MTPWRTSLYHRTRDRMFLWKVSVGIVGVAVLAAALLQSIRKEHADQTRGAALLVLFEDTRLTATTQYRKLTGISRPEPAEFAEWIRGLPEVMEKKAEPWTFDAAKMRVGDMDLQPLLDKHVRDAEQRKLFELFIRSWLGKPGTEREDAVRRVHEMASEKPSLRFAGEFDGDLLMRDHKRGEALAAYLRETHFDDATRARSVAFTTALVLEDKAALRGLCADARCVREIDPYQFFRAAKLLQDRWLIVRGLAVIEWRQWSHSLAVPLALFAAAIWYLILVQGAGHGRMRWLRYLSPVFAGVMSVWLLNWWQSTLHYQMPDDDRDTAPLQEIFQYVIHVGVPEETAKLCLFAVFLPLLLRHGSARQAALTAGCVGLGFALDENLQYYSNFGASVAVGRLVTANFMHIALTGIIGFWCYELFRSRFHRAGEFVAIFIGISAAHGVYDVASAHWAQEWGVNFAGIVILALLARQYFHYVRPQAGPGRRTTISSSSIYFVGLAAVVGVAIVIAVWQMDSMKGATLVLKETLGIIPVGVLFMREFGEMES